jgi:MYXO-CTERM domain-containing protein
MRRRLGWIVAGSTFAASLVTASAWGQSRTWTANADFDAGVFASVVDTSPNHQLVLGPTAVSETHRLVATNYRYGWVVELDTLTGQQTARWDSSRQLVNGVATGAPPPNEYCDFSSTGNCPQFLAVGTDGDVWVVNSAFGKQSTLTRIAGDLSRCVDQNGNGLIDTSFDVNADGQLSVMAGAGEYLGQGDECLRATVKVGPNNVWGRGLAIDRRGRPWVSTHLDGKLYRYSADEPLVLESTLTPGGSPFALAAGGPYVIVARSSGAVVQRVHTDTLTIQSVTCAGFNGAHAVVADPTGDVAWLAGYFTGDGVWRVNFVNNTCALVNVGSQTTAITLDLAGNVWAAGYNTHTIHKLSPAGALLGTYPAGGTSPLGLSVDFQGNVWVVNPGPIPSAAKVNANTGAIVGTYPLGGPGVPDAAPFALGDLTGVQADRISPFATAGSWRGTFDGGFDAIPWSTVSWNAEPQGATPAETALAVSARAADTLAGLDQQPFTPATNGAALAGVVGRFVELRAQLSGPGFVSPALSDLTVTGPCTSPGDACCLADAHCDDGDPCTADACPAPGEACAHAPVLGCCLDDAACVDADACTLDACDLATSQCTHAAAPGCCNTAFDCDDGALCTVDTCSGPGGACTSSPISQCCTVDADCDDGAACTVDTCGPGNVCVHAGVPGCCASDADCQEAPDDLCTANACDLATGTCASTDLTPLGCCNTSADCDDGDACTLDGCSGPGGSCNHAEQADCCTPDDPEVGEPCDAPASPFDAPPCQAGEWACVGGALVCQGAVVASPDVCDGVDNDCNGFVDLPGTCASGQTCVDGGCVDLPSDGGAGAGGAGAGGEGAGGGSGGGASGDVAQNVGCGCAVPADGEGRAVWALGLAALLLARRRARRVA